MPDRSTHPLSRGLSIILQSASFSLVIVFWGKWSECETPLPVKASLPSGRTYIHTTYCPRYTKKRRKGKRQMNEKK